MRLLIILALVLLPLISRAQLSVPNLDLVWEADTYTPSDYAGRSLASTGSNVTVLGLAHTADGQLASGYDFRWEKDGKQIISASGVGANVLVFKAGTPNTSHRVTLHLHDTSGKRIVSQSATIPVQDPKIVFYKEEAWGTDRSRALTGDTPLVEQETKILAEPFYFPTSAVNNRNLTYDWRLNGGSIPAGTERPERFSILLPDPLPDSVRATLELRLTNLTDSLQRATNSIITTYGQN